MKQRLFCFALFYGLAISLLQISNLLLMWGKRKLVEMDLMEKVGEDFVFFLKRGYKKLGHNAIFILKFIKINIGRTVSFCA